MAGFRIAASIRPDPTPKSKVKKKPDYLDFIRTLPCCVTGQHGVQAAHVSFPSTWHGHAGRGKGTKAPDQFALPVNPEAHARQHGMSEPAFWESVGIDPHQLAITLWAIYSIFDEQDAHQRAEARIYQGLAIAGRLPGKELQ